LGDGIKGDISTYAQGAVYFPTVPFSKTFAVILNDALIEIKK